MANALRGTVLVVDDAPMNLDVLSHCLSDEFEVITADNGETALDLAAEYLPDIIVLDIRMPRMDGYEVCRQLKNSPITRGIPVIFLTAMLEEADEAHGLALGAVDYITKPVSPALVKARVRNHIDLKRRSDHLVEMVDERTRELARTQEAIIESLGTLAECRDPEGGGHIRRTRDYIRRLALRLLEKGLYTPPLDEDLIDQFCKSAPLHDLGKIGIPDHILRKEGPLTGEEFEVMKTHTTLGQASIAAAEKRLGSNSFLRYAREIAESHHERWDGTGYPNGLAGAQIPLCGRLMAVADVYDALVSRRVYKSPFPHSTAVDILAENRGTAFDPLMIDAFLEIKEEFRSVALEYADLEEERIALGQ
jgi:putative two-component system response regulator